MATGDDKRWLIRAMELLAISLDQWEHLEDGVREKHAAHLAALRLFFEDYAKGKADGQILGEEE